jgi:hypothetical protein
VGSISITHRASSTAPRLNEKMMAIDRDPKAMMRLLRD